MNELFEANGLQTLLLHLLVSVGIGLLIGLEREYAKRVVDQEVQLFAGIRTYTLITIFGFLAALISDHYGSWILAIALLGLLAFLVMAYKMTAHPGHFGGTSEMSSVLAFLLGALVHEGHVLLAIIITVIVSGLLSLKRPLHRFVASLSMGEVRAIIQFVVISAVMLPFLPNKPFGPYLIWNLKDVWTMVVLVSGISLLGFLAGKVLGDRKGTLVTGLLGGLVSSTAVTVDLARLTKQKEVRLVTAAVTIIAASTIMFPRVLLETFVLNLQLAEALVLPLGVATACGLIAAFLTHRQGDHAPTAAHSASNPLNLGLALQFAILYMGVRWLVAFTMHRYGSGGTYVAALLSGATDMDAITLSMARSAKDGNIDLARNAVLLAAASNTLFKMGLAFVLGDRTLFRYVGFGLGAALIGGLITTLLLAA